MEHPLRESAMQYWKGQDLCIPHCMLALVRTTLIHDVAADQHSSHLPSPPSPHLCQDLPRRNCRQRYNNNSIKTSKESNDCVVWLGTTIQPCIQASAGAEIRCLNYFPQTGRGMTPVPYGIQAKFAAGSVQTACRGGNGGSTKMLRH